MAEQAPPVRPVVDRAEINIRTVGPFGRPLSQQAERKDQQLYHSLQAWQQPAVSEPAPEPPPSTEQYFREQLKLATAVLAEAVEAERQAEAAHMRAREHQQACRQRLMAYADLDNELGEAMTTALRTGADVTAAQAGYASKLTERATAQAEVTAADTAAARLGAEHADASRAAEKAKTATDRLAVNILSFTAQALADEARRLKAEAEARRRCLLGFDRIVSAYRVGLPMAVRVVLGDVDSRTAGLADPVPWKEAVAALRTDPDTPVQIEIPPAVIPPLQVVRGPPTLTFAVPLKPSELPSPPDDGDPGLLSPDSAA
jgi:hypothetical protein